jgi:hypothetical protein
MAGMINTVSDPLLVQARNKAEASVPKQYRRGYDAILAAGLKLMFSDKTFPLMQQYVQTISSPEDTPKVVSHGIVKLISILFNQAKGAFPIEPMGAAAIVLMTHALEYAEMKKQFQLTADLLAETTKLTNQGVVFLLKKASKLDDNQFEQVLAGKGKELAASLRSQGNAPAAAPPAGAPPVAPPAMPPTGGM